MKEFLHFGILLIFLFSCSNEESCPEQVFLGTYEVESQSLSWNPYIGHNQVVFEDANGEEYVFEIIDDIPQNGFEVKKIPKICGEDNSQFVRYSYHYDYTGSILNLISGDLDLVNFGPISVKIFPVIHQEKPQNSLIGDVLSISHLVSPFTFSTGNTLESIVNQRSFPSSNNTQVKLLESYLSNGKEYTSVWTNKDIAFGELQLTTPIRETIFGDIKMYYNKDVGIIDMEFVNGRKLFFKAFN